ncbi:MAG: hypothetical protein HYV08_08315 [Deltaproteobacteria bacterium]|nr:hypothetical protein [Deltaproteobacteria bacterium]MBI3076463.1 hypothetical protein [Deltaproteobacteria bacterium]
MELGPHRAKRVLKKMPQPRRAVKADVLFPITAKEPQRGDALRAKLKKLLKSRRTEDVLFAHRLLDLLRSP